MNKSKKCTFWNDTHKLNWRKPNCKILTLEFTLTLQSVIWGTGVKGHLTWEYCGDYVILHWRTEVSLPPMEMMRESSNKKATFVTWLEWPPYVWHSDYANNISIVITNNLHTNNIIWLSLKMIWPLPDILLNYNNCF